jgi:hypothetical protein
MGSWKKIVSVRFVFALAMVVTLWTSLTRAASYQLRNQSLVQSSNPLSVGGYTEVASDGGIFNFGTSRFYGSMGGQPLNQPIVGMASDPQTGGYWLVAADGGVFSFNAPFFGSMGGHPLNKPIVGMASTPDGRGYWLVAADGGIFTFGDAAFYGSMGGQPLNQPIVGMASDPQTGGYWLVAADGGVFSFNAPFFGSMGGHPLNKPIVGMAAVPPTSTLLIPGAQGFDLSNFQCQDYQGATGGVFYIDEVSGGPFFNNTCLTQEASYFGSASAQGYIFMGNTVPPPPSAPPPPPCPAQLAPTQCPYYQVGYQEAMSSYTYATQTSQVFPTIWWLDVEGNNCAAFTNGQWSVEGGGQGACSPNPTYNTAANAATIQGAVDFLERVKGLTVGIYSTSSYWSSITGDLSLPIGTPLWEPVIGGSCSNALAFGGGSISIVQYQITGPYDQDVAC